MKITRSQLRQLIKVEAERISEGRFTSALKALATPAVPGGRLVSDYSQARAFDDIEDFMESTSGTIEDLNSRVADIEQALETLINQLGA